MKKEISQKIMIIKTNENENQRKISQKVEKTVYNKKKPREQLLNQLLKNSYVLNRRHFE